MGSEAGSSDERVASFARTFAPDRDRPLPSGRREYVWLGAGVSFVVAGVLLLVLAWFASQRALPATGLLAMKPNPGRTVEQLRTLNQDAAPWTVVSALPFLGSGLWMLATRPNRRRAAAAAGVAVVLFAGLGVLAPVDGCVGIGTC